MTAPQHNTTPVEVFRSFQENDDDLRQKLETYQQTTGVASENAALLLCEKANHLKGQGRFSEAEPYQQEALKINRAVLPEEHPAIAQSLTNLAGLYDSQDRHKEAEPLYVEALTIYRKALPEGHPSIAESLQSVALSYHHQGLYSEAELHLLESLAIRREALPADHLDIGFSLNNLGGLYDSQGRRSEAEILYREALEIFRKALGDHHPHTKWVAENLELCLKKKTGRGTLFARWLDRLKRPSKSSP